MKLGPCLKLSDLVSNLTGPGTWDPETGVYTCTFGSNGTCGGTDEEYLSQLELTVKGCGKLRVSGSGTGYKFLVAGALNAVGGHVFGTIIDLSGPGGGDPDDTCATGPMVGTSEGVAEVACGDTIMITFARPSGLNLGEITATATVEVDTP